MPMTARHHHFLPQCYLKGFVRHREKPKLFVVDGLTGKAFTTHTRNVAQERDFHTVDVQGLAPDAVEEAFARDEGDIAPALERVAKTGSLAANDDRSRVLGLATLIAIKNPRRREAMRHFTERVNKQALNLALATPERWASQVRQMKEAGIMSPDEPDDYEGMRAFVEADQYRISMATEAHLALELGVLHDLMPLFVRRGWAILRAPAKSPGFITCDHPVGLDWSEGQGRGFYSPGFGMGGTVVTFPVSKEVALMGTFEQQEDVEAELTETQVALYNANVIAGADRQIYGRDSDFQYVSPWSGGRVRRGLDLVGEILGRRQRRKASSRPPAEADGASSTEDLESPED